ncbi:Akirin2 [Columba guinea]|nr:Akirin2 [Columba guinea]
MDTPNVALKKREPPGLLDFTSVVKLVLLVSMVIYSSRSNEMPEQILYNIKQEYKRMQKRRHLENSFQQTDPCCSTDAQPHAFLLTGPALPGTSSAASSPLKKEQPLFTLRQVGMICERLLKEREEKIREEYEEILTTKLAEQYDAFVKFTHDQIMRRYGEQPASCTDLRLTLEESSRSLVCPDQRVSSCEPVQFYQQYRTGNLHRGVGPALCWQKLRAWILGLLTVQGQEAEEVRLL